MRILLIKVTLVVLATFFSFLSFGQKQPRIHENIDFEWKFNLGDVENGFAVKFDDSQWREVNLPHDFSIEQPKNQRAGGAMGFHPAGIGWYRKTLDIPAEYKGKRITILFDGVYHQSDVYINEKHLGHYPYGYIGFEYDLTKHLNYGQENTIAVRVDHSNSPSSRWYSGSGINRSVWLTVTDPLRVETWGTYVTTPVVEKDKAEIKIVTTLDNTASTKKVTVENIILDAKGKQVAKTSSTASASHNEKTDVSQTLSLPNPSLWGPDSPYLYTMRTLVKARGKVIDNYETTFGVRTIRFDKNKGFFINGENMKLRGVNLHEDAGALGTAVPYRANERKLQILKEWGANAIRLSHNPYAPNMLENCDRLGIMVINESFDKWKDGYYGKVFDEWWHVDLGSMVRRDRNHPSVIIWSVGNETGEQNDMSGEGTKRAQMLVDFVHKLEPTRPTMIAISSSGLKFNYFKNGFADVPDLIGFNYMDMLFEDFKKDHPDWIFFGSETLPYYGGRKDNIRDYNTNNPWYVAKNHEFVPGYFVWPGVDYLGESGWPNKGWAGGHFETTMREKPSGAFLRSEWNKEPMVRIAVKDQSLSIPQTRDIWQWPKMIDHWNFEQYNGQIIDVQTITNCEEVELYYSSVDREGKRNDRFIARRKTSNFENNTITWQIPFTSGKIFAKGYINGKEVAYHELNTSGKKKALRLTADRTTIKADGRDLSYINIDLVDDKGVIVPDDQVIVTVEVTGSGKLAGLDSGDVRSEYSYKGNVYDTYFGRLQAIVQSDRKAGDIKVKVKSEGLPDAELVIRSQ